MGNIVVGITGASGAPYARRLVGALVAAGKTVHCTMSPSAVQVFGEELGIKVNLTHPNVSEIFALSKVLTDPKLVAISHNHQISPSTEFASLIKLHSIGNFSAGIASGSFLTEGMVVCPCSMSSLAAIATGQSSNLLQRAAEVHLKERRKLIVVPRETPLSPIALGNMQRLAELGVIVLPAMPGFYHQPQSIDDLIDFVVGRICDQLGISHQLQKRWGT